MDRYRPSSQEAWNGRVDSTTDADQFRIHQCIKIEDIRQETGLNPGFSFLGYACEEGVKRNKGRVGAANGPTAFRQALSNFARHGQHEIHDLGDVLCEDENMEAAQESFAHAIQWALARGQKVIGIGGGHDIAYAHWKGINQFLPPDTKIGIINLDTHLDLREPAPLTSSGTPFWQISRETTSFHYCCIGAHHYGNTQKLFEEAESLGTCVIKRDELRNPSYIRKLDTFLAGVDKIYLTMDLDGFDASLCPGVSAPSVDGLTLSEVLSILQHIVGSGKLISTDMAELSPVHDINNQTGKMAAYLAYNLFQIWK